MKCHRCEAEIQDDGKFCPQCGEVQDCVSDLEEKLDDSAAKKRDSPKNPITLLKQENFDSLSKRQRMVLASVTIAVISLLVVVIAWLILSASQTALVEKSRENLSPYLQILGADVDAGGKVADISSELGNEVSSGMKSVELMGLVGNVAHRYRYGGQVVDMTWESNDQVAEDDFLTFVERMNAFFGCDSTGRETSWKNTYPKGVFTWEDPFESRMVIGYLQDGKANVRWFLKEKDFKAIFDDSLSGDTNAGGFGLVSDYLSGGEKSDGGSSGKPSSGSHSSHTCQAGDCSKEGTHFITGISGKTEYYCTTHYRELQDMVGSMADDVYGGSSS